MLKAGSASSIRPPIDSFTIPQPDYRNYTRVVCMVCEEKGIEYVLTERPLHAPELLAIHPFGKMFADINLLPILYQVRQAPEGADALAAATHLDRYYDQQAARPSFKNNIPPSGPPRRKTSG